MKNSNVTLVKVAFIQATKNGENVINVKPFEIESTSISEVAGTIANRILFARMQFVKYGAKIGGFSFNRKFNVKITINDLETLDLTDLYALDGVDCRRTLLVDKLDAVRTAKAFESFANQIYDLVRLSMTESYNLIEDMPEVKSEVIPQLVGNMAKALIA